MSILIDIIPSTPARAESAAWQSLARGEILTAWRLRGLADGLDRAEPWPPHEGVPDIAGEPLELLLLAYMRGYNQGLAAEVDPADMI